MNKTTILKTLTLLTLTITGCNDSERVAQVATQAADRQAQQNQEMAKLNHEVAAGARHLVAADAEARREMVVVHKELQGERGEMNQQWNALETERQEIAQQRRTESMLIPIAQGLGLVVLAVVVIGFGWTLLYGLQRRDESDTQLADLLIQDIVSERPVVLPADSTRRAIRDGQPSAGGDTQLLSDNSTDT